MDAPAMVMHKHVPEEVGFRNIGEEEGGQQQMHREDENQHKPVFKKVKEKVKKIRNAIAGHGGHNGDGGESAGGGSSSSSSEQDEEDMVAQRDGEVEQGWYQEDVEDKPVVMESDPEVHGAPMYDSEKIPAMQEVEGGDVPRVQLGDLGGPVVEDPDAPHSTTPAPRGGEDIGTTPVVRVFESMSVYDDTPRVGAGNPDVEVLKEPIGAASGTSYTDKIKSTAAGTTLYGKNLATTMYEKVAVVGTAMVRKVQQVTHSAGAAVPVVGSQGTPQDDTASATAAARAGASEPVSGHEKGTAVISYIANMMRPSDEDCVLSEAISGAVRRRKEEVGSTVAQRLPAAAPGNAMAKAREAPAQVLTKAREAVSSLTGGSNDVSETVQPTTGMHALLTIIKSSPSVYGRNAS
ncbi:hypothetical protein GUJ93_ZPchr0010g9737 [Zizania palustris]|uniref:Uncharacterized protein n=1 Tax=Zizania palustris TaxID=103762 RepID=A0A8J5W786_ZIZPA|nr:hypothetical protein GUJ93_ZPchr0010g9737 [Zizania palustris]